MQEFGRILVIVGLCLAAVGFLLWKAGARLSIGRLPGDIAIEKPGFSFYAPLGTCFLLSVLLSLVLWFFRR